MPPVKKATAAAKKKPPARKRASSSKAFPAAKSPIEYGKDLTKEPLLFKALAPIVAEAAASGHVSSWREANGKPISQLRSAAKAHGYKINISRTADGKPVFRLNGLIAPLGAA